MRELPVSVGDLSRVVSAMKDEGKRFRVGVTRLFVVVVAVAAVGSAQQPGRWNVKRRSRPPERR
jgi:hypothetical protein